MFNSVRSKFFSFGLAALITLFAITIANAQNYLGATVWNATDLNKFPLKIEGNEDGKTFVMLFSDVNTDKPDPAQFDPPADCTKYDNFMSMMMGRMGGGPPR